MHQTCVRNSYVSIPCPDSFCNTGAIPRPVLFSLSLFFYTDSFDEEPYQLYDDFVMTVLGISDVTAEAGAADTIVVGVPKRLNFTGGGAVESGDRAFWISGGKVDSDCLVGVFLDGPEGIVDSLLGADVFIPDEDLNDKAGHTWTLCYRFG